MEARGQPREPSQDHDSSPRGTDRSPDAVVAAASQPAAQLPTSWARRHPILTAVAAVAGILVAFGAGTGPGANSPSAPFSALPTNNAEADQLGLSKVSVRITNSTDRVQSYFVTVSVNDAAGNRLGDANGASNSVAAGAPSRASCPAGVSVQRGECWRYQLRAIPVGPMVIISAQYVIDGPAGMLYGVPVISDDPGGLTAVPSRSAPRAAGSAERPLLASIGQGAVRLSSVAVSTRRRSR